jgi:hypothetical protein
MPGRKSNRRSRKQGKRSRAPRNPVAPTAMRSIPPEWDPSVIDAKPMKMPRDPQCVIRRTYSLATMSANTGDTVLAFYFALNNMPNYTDFTNLFDSYSILEAVVTFLPFATSTASTAVTSSFPGYIGTWLETNDASLPANMSEGQQYESFQRNVATVPFARVVRPRSAVAAYSGTFTSYANKYGQWIDTASPAVQFYGLKSVITGSTYATSTKVYEVEATITVKFRSIK